MEQCSNQQLHLDFDSPDGGDGYTAWIEQRRAALNRLARQLGLPLGYRVEVWLHSGIRLRGALELNEQLLFVPEQRDSQCQFAVEGVPFSAAEIESCIRLD